MSFNIMYRSMRSVIESFRKELRLAELNEAVYVSLPFLARDEAWS